MTNVRFSSDDDRLVSVGGADTAVIVWRLQGGSHDAESCSLAVACSTAYMSEDSDTDSEEEGHYADNRIVLLACMSALAVGTLKPVFVSCSLDTGVAYFCSIKHLALLASCL